METLFLILLYFFDKGTFNIILEHIIAPAILILIPITLGYLFYDKFKKDLDMSYYRNSTVFQTAFTRLLELCDELSNLELKTILLIKDYDNDAVDKEELEKNLNEIFKVFVNLVPTLNKNKFLLPHSLYETFKALLRKYSESIFNFDDSYTEFKKGEIVKSKILLLKSKDFKDNLQNLNQDLKKEINKYLRSED